MSGGSNHRHSQCFNWYSATVLTLCSLLQLTAVHASAGTSFQQLMSDTRLLALGDIHGSEKPMDYLLQQLQQPTIARQIDNIVVEFGNSRYQQLADDYVLAGMDIPPQQLNRIWRETLYFMAWQTPQYIRLIEYLRQYNGSHSHHIRLVLAEPVFDWNRITRDEWNELTVTREASYQHIIQTEVVDKNESAVLLFGSFHQMKEPIEVQGKEGKFVSVVARLVQQGIKVITVWPHTGPVLENYPQSALIDLRREAFGQQRLSDFSPRFLSNEPLRNIADYYLYQGADLRDARPDPANITDTDWHTEMLRRAYLLGGRVEQQVKQWLEQYSTKPGLSD
ncbi:hypothetical protein [Oceanobacter mangrovi]|uniref:hypothetical protein n=1 Tax=Oceanobacter mangrovi TaxID=2862510 RepID=UPI001C8CF9A7|nr:hypothetical protein [Oceanobacter mangrovi]